MNQTLTVASWNILSDKGGFFGDEHQATRLTSITRTLTQLGELDIVGLMEVENNDDSGHHGQTIARKLSGVDGDWTLDPTGREDLQIYLGLFGKELQDAESYDLTGGRSMLVSHIGDIVIGLVHLSYGYGLRSDTLRTQQVGEALGHMASYEKAVLMGDFNSASWQRSRKIIEGVGFTSVFQTLNRKRPPTVMTEKYRQRLSFGYKLATTYGFSPDDIYTKGLSVHDAGIFEGDSDHRGVWAQIGSL